VDKWALVWYWRHLGWLEPIFRADFLYENFKIRPYEKDYCLQPAAYSGVLFCSPIVGLAGDDISLIPILHHFVTDRAGAPGCGSETGLAASLRSFWGPR
jgi:hypothetical protein